MANTTANTLAFQSTLLPSYLGSFEQSFVSSAVEPPQRTVELEVAQIPGVYREGKECSQVWKRPRGRKKKEGGQREDGDAVQISPEKP